MHVSKHSTSILQMLLLDAGQLSVYSEPSAGAEEKLEEEENEEEEEEEAGLQAWARCVGDVTAARYRSATRLDRSNVR